MPPSWLPLGCMIFVSVSRVRPVPAHKQLREAPCSPASFVHHCPFRSSIVSYNVRFHDPCASPSVLLIIPMIAPSPVLPSLLRPHVCCPQTSLYLPPTCLVTRLSAAFLAPLSTSHAWGSHTTASSRLHISPPILTVRVRRCRRPPCGAGLRIPSMPPSSTHIPLYTRRKYSPA